MRRKKILLTNDDGIHSPGLQGLAQALAGVAEVCVVAPDRDRSNASHALTVHAPLRLDRVTLPNSAILAAYATDGTPADCVYLSVCHLFRDEPVDLVVSGVNDGFNVADDITYSGTVAAALEASLLDVPAIAVSMEAFAPGECEQAFRFTRSLVTAILDDPAVLPPANFLNVNIPHGANGRFAITGVGRRRYSKAVQTLSDPKGRPWLWIGGDAQPHDARPGSDCDAVFDRRMISVSPLHADMTNPLLQHTLRFLKLPGND